MLGGRRLWEFQSTLPIQGETYLLERCVKEDKISIHSPYTGRDRTLEDWEAGRRISIHSPYTGRDGFRTARGEPVQSISIHSPYTGRDAYRSGKGIEQLVFQSTLPIQGETLNRSRSAMRNIFQSTLPIQGETVRIGAIPHFSWDFNPLSLYRERQWLIELLT